MNIKSRLMLKNIQAELVKLNYAPIFWLIGGTVVSIVVLIYFAHYNDVESISAIGKNPWIKYWNATVGIFSVFISVPFLVLLISACFFIENNNNTWKYLYVTPNSRASILMIKLFVIIILIFITYLLLVLLTLALEYLYTLQTLQ